MKIELLILISILALFNTSGFAQTETNIPITKHIHGRVKNLTNDVSNVLIINLNSDESTITDYLGVFTIEAKLNDSIQFTAVQYQTKNIVITERIYLKNSVEVNLVENVINLNEVTVTPYNLSGKIEQDITRLGIEPAITSSTLGLPNAEVKILSQSERLLLVADRGEYTRFMTIEEKLKSQSLLGLFMIGTIINSDKITNRFSGRTEVFENMVVNDANLELEKEIIAKYSKKTMSENLDIPEVNIDGFLTFCMSQKGFSEISKTEDMLLIWEYLKSKSIEFKE
ncbi:hypothetical protein [uncultured Maribacter sp.]|uniref:hypothetical protein n=1 Tax=uncultured Maribacter sp. TaxID=431308 RepID=UPI00260CB370|nr:hypothetical protein [uncultured Maribacter sp.]